MPDDACYPSIGTASPKARAATVEGITASPYSRQLSVDPLSRKPVETSPQRSTGPRRRATRRTGPATATTRRLTTVSTPDACSMAPCCTHPARAIPRGAPLEHRRVALASERPPSPRDLAYSCAASKCRKHAYTRRLSSRRVRFPGIFASSQGCRYIVIAFGYTPSRGVQGRVVNGGKGSRQVLG